MPSSTLLSPNNVELISDDVKEIISYRPHWIIRKGNVVFFAILLSMLAATWVIKYPDVVQGAAAWWR